MATPVGQAIRLTATFKDATGALTTPAAPAVNITTPAAVTTAFNPVNDSNGIYHYDYTPTTAGSYTWWFSGTGVAQLPDIFTVTGLATGALVSLADVKDQLSIPATSTADDQQLWRYIQTATGIVNRKCGYTAATPFTETANFGRADSSGNQTIVLARTPVLSVTSITPQLQGLPGYDLTALIVNQEAGIIYLSNWMRFYGPVTVAYIAGRGFVPQELQTACLILVRWMWRTQSGGVIAIPGPYVDESGAATEGMPYEALALMNDSPYDAAPGIA